MNTALKIVLASVAVAMLLCVAAGGLGIYLYTSSGFVVTSLVETDRAQAARVGSEIIEYDVPAGFPYVVSAELAGYSMIAYTGSDHHSHIYICQLPAGVTVDLSEMERDLQKAFPATVNEYSEVSIKDTQPATIAGQEVTLVTSEGTNHEGNSFRQVSTALQGKGGQVFVIFSRPTASWDQAEVDAFLASIQ